MDLLRSLPLGFYLEQPITWLHRLDPRVKLAWLMAFLVTPLLATLPWRIGIVVALLLLTVLARIPWRALKQQMGWILIFCFLILGITAVMPDGLAVRSQPRLPADEFQIPRAIPPSTAAANRRQWYDPFGWFQPSPPLTQKKVALPQPPEKPYRYVLLQQGPVTITRQSLRLGIQLGTGYFTLIYSTTLFLLATAPEEITAALDRLVQPLKRWKIPIVEISLTLTLSLRFIPLVLEEVQNLVRSVQTRAINWKKLGFRGAAQLWLTVADRLLENLFLRAEQIASAMASRGFTSPNRHQVKWQQLRMRSRDWVALGLLSAVLGLRILIAFEPF
ncbi:energy-coupling factor transporter transmembrane component T family protein [Altericista sp. CCNU0014]|uniref:energy-coupling factor transporter transmembrane component T family protein n=1 Tax=Altericista sp. CCNU0014 TaxID=3082949 RepID=UPI00384E1C06